MHSIGNNAGTAENALKNVRMRRNGWKPPNSPDGARWAPDIPNGFRNHADTSGTRTDGHSIKNNAKTATNATKTIRASPNEPKLQNSPIEAAKQRSEERYGLSNRTDALTIRRDSHSVGNNTKTAGNISKNIRTRQIDPKMRNSPHTPENGTPKHSYQWRKVSAGSINVYAPLNVQIAPLGRNFVFGQVGGGDEVMAVREVGERAGNGSGVGNRDEWNGDGDDTTSSGSVDSKRVKTALLAANSQHTCYRSRFQGNGLPVLSWPPIQPVNNPYGPARHKHRRGKLKIERLNDKKSAKPDMIETAHLERASAVQPHGSTSNRVHGVYRPSRRCGSLEIEAIKVNPAWNGETTHLWCGHVTQPHGNPSEHSYGVIGPIRRHGQIKFVPTSVSCKRQCQNRYLGHHQPMPPFLLARIQTQRLIYGASRSSVCKRRCRRPKIKGINVSQMLDGKTTYLWHAHVAQPLDNISKRCFGDFRCRWHHGRIKITSTEVSQARNIETAYLACAHTAQPHGSPLKWSYRVFGPRRRRGQLKIAPTNVSRKHKEQNTYQGLYKPKLLLPLDPSDPARSTSIKSLQYGLQSLKKNLQNVSREDNKSIGSYTHLSANGSTTHNAFIAST